MDPERDAGRTGGARARRRREMRRVMRRSAVLTLFSTVLPGAGLTRVRRYRVFGWLLVLVCLAVLVAALALALTGTATETLLSLAVRPYVLLGLAGGVLVGGMVWMFAIVLTHRGTLAPILEVGQRRGLQLFTAVMCLLVALPTVTAVRYSLIQREVVTSLAPGPRTGASDGPTVRPGTGSDPWENASRVNMLLIGSDAGDDRIGTRTDSMILASIDPGTGNALLVGIPRNLERVPFPASNPLSKIWPNGYHCPERGVGNECLLNAVWQEAEEHKDLFKNDPHPGLTTLRAVIREVTGLSVDYSTVIDLKGFSSLVDAMGGVDVNVRERLPVEGSLNGYGRLVGVQEWIEPGEQHLDGYHALWFARSRLTTSDYDRMRRQRCLVGSILTQVDAATMLTKYPQLATVARENVSTDLPIDDLPAWVDLVNRIQQGQLRSLAFTDDVINPANPNFEKMRQLIAEAIAPPSATPTPTATIRPTTPGSSDTPTSPATPTPAPTEGLVDLDAAC